MQDFIKCFIQEPSGAWRCVRPGTINLPSGRVQVTVGSVFFRGTRFMNIDLAEVLDQEQAKTKRR